MTERPARYTIERTDAPASRRRFLGHDDAGALAWLQSFAHANDFPDEDTARSFIRHRLPGLTGGQIVRHTIH